MSRWLAKPVSLHIGAHESVLADAVLPARCGEWGALADTLSGAPTGRLAVTVADCWVRYFLLAPPEGVASLRDCRLLLTARFEALYGHSPADWVLQADWQAGRPMLACALPRALVAALAPFKPASIRPLMLTLWNRHCARLPSDGALCAQADGQANLLYWRAGQIRLVRQQKGADAEALLALELARLDAEMPAMRYWRGAAAPAGWAPLEVAP